MRDLARQGIIRRRSSLTKNFKIVAVVVFAAVFVFFAGRNLLFGTSVSSDSSLVKDAPKGLTPVKIGAVLEGESGLHLSTDDVNLRNVKEGGTASATRTYGDGSYVLSVNATLPDPKGNRYQVWLSDGTNVFDAGFMNGSKTAWTLIFRDKDNFSKSYDEVWITREITTEDEKPELVVMRGTF